LRVSDCAVNSPDAHFFEHQNDDEGHVAALEMTQSLLSKCPNCFSVVLTRDWITNKVRVISGCADDEAADDVHSNEICVEDGTVDRGKNVSGSRKRFIWCTLVALLLLSESCVNMCCVVGVCISSLCGKSSMNTLGTGAWTKILSQIFACTE